MFKSIAQAFGRGLAAFGRRLPDLARDCAGLAAVGLIAYGAWLVYEPAGFIAGGALLLTGVLMASFGKKPSGG